MAAIVLDGDASGAVRAAGLAERAMRRVAGAVDDLDTKHKASAFSGRNLAERLTDIDKAAQIVGGPLSGLTPTLNDMGDAIEQVGLKAAVQNVAMAGLASGGIAAVVAAGTAAIGVMVGLGVNAVAVSSDIAGFDSILGANSSTMQRNRADLVALADAQSDLALSTAAARVELAGLAAPVMTELSYAAAGAAGSVQALAEDETGAVSATIGLGEATVALVPGLNVLAAQVWAGSYAIDAMAESGRQNAATLEAGRDAVEGADQQLRLLNQSLHEAIIAHDEHNEAIIREMIAMKTGYFPALVEQNRLLGIEAEQIEEWYAPSFDMMADAVSTYRASMLGSTAATKSGGKATREAAEDYNFLADSAREAATAVAAASQLRADQDTVANLPSAQTSTAFGIGAEDRAGFAAAGGLGADAVVEESATMRDEVVSNLNAIGSAAVELQGMVVNAMAAAFEGSTDRSIKARKKQFAAMKAAALLEAGINTALAVTNALATAPNPIIGAVLAALVGVAGAVQIGLIAAKQPNFAHRGGLLPDEVPVIARKNERQAVITAQGMTALGGEEGLKRVNAGSSPPMTPSITLVADGMMARFREFARPDPGFGQRTRFA